MQRRPRIHNEKHLAFIRTLPCLITKCDGVEAAHIRYADPRIDKRWLGKGEKPDDIFVVPLCSRAHREQHAMNERKFWEGIGIDPILYALRLWSVTGDYEAGRNVVMAASVVMDAKVQQR